MKLKPALIIGLLLAISMAAVFYGTMAISLWLILMGYGA